MPHRRRNRSVVRKREAKSKRYWSAGVMQKSNALDLKGGVFRMSSPHKIAMSLKGSSERSKRRKATPYQSAMSMLNFYINRMGRNMGERKRKMLERTKDELRALYGRN